MFKKKDATRLLPDSVISLDKLLNIISFEEPCKHGITLHELYKRYRLTYENYMEMQHALDMLLEDGNIQKGVETNGEVPIKRIYFKRLKGELYSLAGGYAGTIAKDRQNGELENRLYDVNKRIRNLTRWIAVAAVIAAVYSLLQIIEYLSTHYWCI